MLLLIENTGHQSCQHKWFPKSMQLKTSCLNYNKLNCSFGARGTITNFYNKFRHQFGLGSKLGDNIVVLTIKDSYLMI